MAALYKLTDENHQTQYGNLPPVTWGVDVEHTATGGTPGQFGPDCIYAYDDPRCAVLLTARHKIIENPVLWSASGDISSGHCSEAFCTRLQTIAIQELPVYTAQQRAVFALTCTLQACDDAVFQAWAADWIAGSGRAADPAAAYMAAVDAAETAAGNAASNPLVAGVAAAKAAETAARAAEASVVISDGLLLVALLEAVRSWAAHAASWSCQATADDDLLVTVLDGLGW